MTGLHFDNDTFKLLRKKNIAFARVTLHVGDETFQLVRVWNLCVSIGCI